MKFSRGRLCAVVGTAVAFSLLLGGVQPRAQVTSTPARKNKVIIYPTGKEKISELKSMGITNVENYGSYWLATATDAQVDSLKKTRGNRANKANYLNLIELNATTLDTTKIEPSVPSEFQQTETVGKRLRLVQLKGPAKLDWLNQIKAAGDVKVVSYIPNNAYVLWLDADAEQNLNRLLDPQGPIQWIGPYHPYYKVPQELRTISASAPIEVRVCVVEDSSAQSASAAYRLQAFGSVKSSTSLNGQEIVQLEVAPSIVLQIAQLPDVLWVEKVVGQRTLDEVQDLVLAGQSPTGLTPPPPISSGTNYLNFLINTVGGGLGSFTDPNTYPVVDVADTGVDNGSDPSRVTVLPFHPVFYNFGRTNSGSRIVYTLPAWLGGDPLPQLGCTTRIVPAQKGAFRTLETADLDGHGTFVASVLAGFDNGTNRVNVPNLQLLPPVSNTVPVTIDCAIVSNASASVLVPNGFTNVCLPGTFTNVTYTGLNTNGCPTPIVTNTIILYTAFTTNANSEVRVSTDGFQLGMGVSPFGRIGAQRVWGTMESSAFTLSVVDSICSPQFFPTTLCINDLVAMMSSPYSTAARIQNNSWADIIEIHGLNGGVYNAESQTFDSGVRDAVLSPPGTVAALNQEFIVVFACNTQLTDGGSRDAAGGFVENRVTAPATAKNVISVASAGNPNDFFCSPGENSLAIPDFSAAGRMADFRFKPEIVAPGSFISGAKNQLAPSVTHPISGLASTNCQTDQLIPLAPDIITAIHPGCTSTSTLYTSLYECRSGSSYAAPAVSGAIQLLWWYFQHRLTDEIGTPLLQPSPAMAKAFLCNAARYLPITNPATGALDTLPSILQGMGELDLQRMFDGVSRVIRDESAPRAIDTPLLTTNQAPQQTYFSQSGQSYEVNGEVSNSNLPFRVTLAWIDPPGNPAAGKQLVNDLDLEVTVGGNTYRGNVFQEDHSIVGGDFNHVDNMESVFLLPGTTTNGASYRVKVIATAIAGDGVPNVAGVLDQDFALVIYNSQNPSDVPNLSTNNACATAMNITQIPFTFTNTLTKSVYHNVQPSPTAATGGSDEFFKLTRPTAGTTFTVDTFGSAFDTVLSVWMVRVIPQGVFVRGDCGALTELVSNNDAGGGAQSQLSFTSDGSNDYFIVVEPQNDGPGGKMVLNVQVSNPPVTVTPSHLAFAGQIQGTTSSVQTVVYQNNSIVPVQVTDVSITGTDPLDFIISSQTCEGNFINPGTNCLIRVAFTPQAAGARLANLVISDNASGSPRTVPLTGTGLPPAPLVCLSSGSLSFTNQAVGTTSAAQILTLTNCGTAALTVSNVTLSGPASNDFSVVQTCTGSSPIAPGGTCTLTVTFTPASAGHRGATLNIQSSDGVLTTVPLLGTGFVPAPAVCLSASSLAFGAQGVGTTSAVQSVTVTNCGTTNLTITGVGLIGTNAADFQIVANSCGSLTAGGTCSISVDFTPTVGGPLPASLAITNNASGSPHLVSLTGAGAVSQPDAAIGKTTKTKKMVGNGVINSTGVGQEFVQKVKRGAKHGLKFYVTLKNVGSNRDQFTVDGDGDSAGFTVNYFLSAKDSTDITAGVEAGTFASSTLAVGAVTSDATLIRVEVFADKGVPKGTVKSFTIKFTSVADLTSIDAVKATVIAK